MYSVHCTLYRVPCKVLIEYLKMNIQDETHIILLLSMNIINVYYYITFYNIHYAMYSVHCTVYCVYTLIMYLT